MRDLAKTRLSYTARSRHHRVMPLQHALAPPVYHWTPATRARFVDVLAATGSVRQAAAAAGKCRDAAYKLRRRKGEGVFRAAWDAAILVARDYVGDAVLPSAFEPIVYHAVVNARGRTSWRRVDPLLGPGMGLSLVTRLERAGARVDANPVRRAAALALVPRVFDSMLGLEHDESGVDFG